MGSVRLNGKWCSRRFGMLQEQQGREEEKSARFNPYEKTFYKH